jgi:hypothetical protein
MTILLGDAGDRAGAMAHAASCSDCWAVLAVLHALAAGTPPEGADRMAGLFGCGPVQESLFELVGLDAGEMRVRQPGLARHLGWCAACRERFAEVAAVELAVARGEVEPVIAPAPPRWRTVTAQAGEAVREAAGRLVLELGRAAAAFTTLPDGFTLAPATAAGALRGTPVPVAAGGQQVRFALPDSALWADLRIEPEPNARFALLLEVSGFERPRLSLHLREERGEQSELLARQTMPEEGPAVVRGLTPGHYLLEIQTLRNRKDARRYRLRFDVESAE